MKDSQNGSAKREQRHFTGRQKVSIVKQHLVDGVVVCLWAAWGWVLLGLLPLAIPAAAATSRADQTAEVVRVKSPWLVLGFAASNGSLLQIDDVATGHAHLGDPGAANRANLWRLKANITSRNQADQGNHKRSLLLTPDDADQFVATKTSPQGDAIRLVWSHFRDTTTADLVVEVFVRLSAHTATSTWQLTIGNAEGLAIEEIHFPVVSGIARQQDEVLAVPYWMGEKHTNPRGLLAGQRGAGRRLEWSYPGHLSLQCLAYYRQSGPGLYLACHDATCQRKRFAIWGDKNLQVHTEIVHTPETFARGAGAQERPRPPRNQFALAYDVELGTFRGDWLTAAERYRQWAVQQAWARGSRLARGAVPDWVLQTGLWVWNRGRSPGVLAPAAALRERLRTMDKLSTQAPLLQGIHTDNQAAGHAPRLPVSVLWYWWHGCAYDSGFPEYLPPREGTKAFRRAVAEAHRHNIHTLVYMNQRLWGMKTTSWTKEHAAAFAVKAANGQIRSEVYNTFTRQPCASMCMGTAFWRNKYAGLAEQVVRDLGVDGIYMDQACSSLPCYDPAHGHPLGAGNYWTEGFRQLADDIRRRGGADRKVALAGEGCGEPWLTELDLMLTLQVSRERYAGIADGWEVIPFFHAVYHPFAILFGNYSSLTVPPYDDLWPAEFAPARPLALLDPKYCGQFYLEQARAFVWGQQPTIANFLPIQLQMRPHEIDYVLQLARLRKRAEAYLVHGTFLRPPTLNAPSVELDFSRLSIYAGQRDRVQSFRKTCPSALAAAWRAPDGSVGIALASIVDHPLTLSVGLNVPADAVPHDSRIERLTATGRSAIGKLDAHQSLLPLQLAPREACVLKITAER